MPGYLEILREASVASIYILFITVIIFLIARGRIRDVRLASLFYGWLPAAVLTQFLMTFIRLQYGKSNLPIMNFYLILEFIIFVIILVKIREKEKKILINYKLWAVIIAAGVLTHFIYEFDKIHNASMFYIAVVYFQLSVNFIDLNKIDKFISDPYSLLHIAVFVKAFGYSYFLIYQSDYTFPLSIYSALNLLVQLILILTLIQYYKYEQRKEH
jgi:hypothetical protein